MKALIIGATGATGKDLTEQLLADDAFDEIHIFVRKLMVSKDRKLKVHIVNFDSISSWANELRGDVLFSALGTTIGDAGSQDAQWKVDHTYQYQVAKAAKANGVSTYVLVSSGWADVNSKYFYMRMKAQLEEDVKELGFKSTTILRPPSLIRKDTTRFGEKVSVAALKAANAVGLFKSFTPMPTDDVAMAMVDAAKKSSSGVTVLEADDIRQMMSVMK